MNERHTNPPGSGTDLVPRGNLLGPVIRRDIADLNRLFLELSIEPGLDEDPRFALSEPVRVALAACPPEVLGRLAQSPFCLFQLQLPAAGVAGLTGVDRVADARQPAPLEPATAARCHSFVLLSLTVARQLAGGMPLSTRIALGVSADVEARLADMSPSQLAQLATWPGLVRPRWPRHEGFWGMLIGASRAPDPSLLRWAHCAGLCLLATGPAAEDRAVHVASRRRGRAPRGPPGSGVPC